MTVRFRWLSLSVALAALALVGCGEGVLHSQTLTLIDVQLRAALRVGSPHSASWWWAKVVSDGGQRGVTAPVVVGVAIFVAKRRATLRPVIGCLSVLLLLAVSGWLLKHGVGRSAPRSGRLAVHSAGASWPSGHAANAVVSGALLLWLERTRTTPWPRSIRCTVVAGYFVLVLAVGLSTVWLDYHWSSDVLGGWLLGAVIVGSAWLVAPPTWRSHSPAGGSTPLSRARPR